MVIGNRIPALRSEQKLSQDALAKAIGVTRATINAIEKGKYNPSLELAFRISRYFQQTIEDIFLINEKGEN